MTEEIVQHGFFPVGVGIPSCVSIFAISYGVLLGCPGYVVIDDSILHPAQSYDEDGLIPKNSPNVWLTPMYFRDVWHWRRIFAQLDLITQTKERTHGKPDM